MRIGLARLLRAYGAAWLLLMPAWASAQLSCDAAYSINSSTLRSVKSPYTDGSSTLLLTSPALSGVNALGLDPNALGRLYYLATPTPPTVPATDRLYYVDFSVTPPTTGNVAAPAFTVPSAAGETLAFDAHGTAYAYDSGVLYRQGLPTLAFTTLTGGAPPSTLVSQYKINDIVVDAAGVVYGVGLYPNVASPVSAHLIRFHPAQAPQAEYVRALTLTPAAPLPALSSGLAFAPGSTAALPLLLWTASGTGTYEINVATGAATRLTSTGRADLASCPRHTLLRRVTLDKTWVGSGGGEQVALQIGGAVITAVDGSSVAGGPASAASALVAAGGSVTLTETFQTGAASDFVAALACTRLSDGTAVSLAGHTLTMPADSDVACRLENRQRPRLTLLKQVQDTLGPVPAAPTAWTLSAEGGAAGRVSGRSGTTEVTQVSTGEGSYVLSESAGVAGYELTGWACTGAALTGDRVTLDAGANATCTATNRRITASLQLGKRVAGGGPAQDWNFSVASACLAAPISVTVPAAGGTVTIDDLPTHATDGTPCSYELTEAARPGWVASDWGCSHTASANGNRVTLAAHAPARCDITNTRAVGAIALTKQVLDAAGPVDPWWFTLSAQGAGCLAAPVTLSVPGSGGRVDFTVLPTHADDGSLCRYALDEAAVPGWRLDAAASSPLLGVTLAGGAAPLELTAVNRAMPAPLAVPALPLWPLAALLIAVGALRRRRGARTSRRG